MKLKIKNFKNDQIKNGKKKKKKKKTKFYC